MSRWRWVLVGLLAAGVAVTVAALILWDLEQRRYIQGNPEPIPLDARGWARGSATQRYGMALSLTRRRTLVGRTRDDLVAMLGPPLGDRPPVSPGWLLGLTRGGSMMWDTEYYLIVTFDDQGRCQKADVSMRD